ncbi:NAD(P)/FAD-dependent oxidoreductase [Nocardioides marmorisolisilvae]|uniref:FAD-binding domain-containing protein n=1 Tax=Nocardioides marmorisolisilvae TaxID=1542737 RepID=A0A3N0DVL8_9ACTN|nr:hypothetical protein [Nocardioides marmorisolisilvae]RNL79638.1 hypothetical protein EFL95_11765 [Nocardioides marmorisolisilvae]
MTYGRTPPRRGALAVVLGGSVAGLCSAAAVAPFFDEVVVLERDELPAGPEHRRGTPQSRHPHFLLNAGRSAIENLLPGTTKELLAAGAREFDPALLTAYCEPHGWAPRKPGPLTMLYTSRILLEHVLREQVAGLVNVRVVERADVEGLRFTTDGSSKRVDGVGYSVQSEAALLDVDLVVDALGRGSGVPRWVGDAVGTPVPEQTLNAKVMYSSRWYQPPSGKERPVEWWWEHLALLPLPAAAREEDDYMATIFPVEGGRWIAFLGSWGHDMPTTPEEFEHRAANLRTPLFLEAIRASEPLSDIHVTRATANIWRRYDRYDALPLGLVSVGDAACAFNPLYGQGMSAAAVSAQLLGEAIRDHADIDRAMVSQYHRRQAAFLDIPWSLAVTRDQVYDHATGTETLPDGLRKRLLNRLTWPVFGLISQSSREDDVIAAEFSAVFNLEQSMTGMLRRPRVLAGLLFYAIKRATGRTRLPAYPGPRSAPPATIHSPTADRLAR